MALQKYHRHLGVILINGLRKNVLSNSIRNFSDQQDESHAVVKRKPTPNEIFTKEFPEHFRDGRFVSRIGYVQFIDEALAKMKELGLERDREAYKELFRIFPPGEFHATSGIISKWQFYPQQLAATRVLHQMAINNVRIDKDIIRLAIAAFSIDSEVWNRIARTTYWHMKLRNIDRYPLPEELPKEPHKLAKIGLQRMLDDELSIITTTNTANLPDSIDKTWLVFSQSPTQRAIIDSLDEKSMLYIEEGGRAWVGRDSLSYFVLKYYIDPELAKKKAAVKDPDFDMTTLDMNFYGKPIREKLADQFEKHYVDGAYILSIGMTGTSSQDSISSWLKILQQRNTKLRKLNVVFRMQHRAPDIVEYDPDHEQAKQQRQESSNG